MSRKTQSGVAGGLLVLGVLAPARVLYLAYVFPHQVAFWDKRGVPLSGAQLWLANLRTMRKEHGMLMIPALFFGVVACGAWASATGPCSGTADSRA